MHPKEDGTYYITYENVAVGRNGETKSYPFKIAANGNWDSGISYGDENGDGSNVDTCVVTINFNPKTKKISVETNPSDCNMSDIGDSTFQWYVVGDYQLVSYDSFKASTSVYDTIRDITSNFSFTSDGNTNERGISWSINDERNNAGEFKSKMGDNGFTLDY